MTRLTRNNGAKTTPDQIHHRTANPSAGTGYWAPDHSRICHLRDWNEKGLPFAKTANEC